MGNKIIDVPSAHMGVEVLSDKGQIIHQEAPEKPFTTEDFSEMMQAMGNPEKAKELQKASLRAMTKEGLVAMKEGQKEEVSLKVEEGKTKILRKTVEEEKKPIPLIPKPEDGETKEEWRIRYKKNQEIAAENQRMLDDGEIEDTSNVNPHAEQANPSGIQLAMRDKLAVSILTAELPLEVIEELNDHIDETIIPAKADHSSGLVGQINQNEKSAQLTFPTKDDEVGKVFEGLLLKVAKEYMQQATFANGGSMFGENPEYDLEVDNAWTIHSYAGDYNPVHDHGTKTPIGLSCILYLKVPEVIRTAPNPAEEFGGLNNSSGAVNGFTYLTWGANGMRDANMFRPVTEEYVKPEEGLLLMFPSWLRHGVMPFFGEGERRTFSANINVTPKVKN